MIAKKLIKHSNLLSYILIQSRTINCKSFTIERPELEKYQNASLFKFNTGNLLFKSQNKSFSVESPRKISFEINYIIRNNLVIILDRIEDQKNCLIKLRESLEENKSNFLSTDLSEKLLTYKCTTDCLTINELLSDSFESTNDINFYITESRNELRYNLKKIMTEAKKFRLPLKLQVSGSVGVGKTFGLAEFVVLERMLNLDAKDKFIIYHNFNKITNKVCLLHLSHEIFSAIYPFIKTDLDEALKSNLDVFTINLEENSLYHLLLKLYNPTNNREETINLIQQIFEKMQEVYPDFQLLLVLDQVNEIGKGDKKTSNAFFDFIKDFKQNNLVTIFCASCNNEFSRENILLQTPEIKIINYDLKLKDEEAVSLIKDMGYLDEEQIKGILNITKKVPLFLKFLKRIDGKNHKEKIKNLKNKIKDFIESRATNFFREYYQGKFEHDDRTIFKKIIYYLNSQFLFRFSSIKDLLDYQLFEVEFVNPKISEQKSIEDITEQSTVLNENQVVIDLYDYIENKVNFQKKSSDNYIFEIEAKKDPLVRVKTQYPMIFKVYQDVFEKNHDKLVCPEILDLAIRDYIDHNNKYEEEKELFQDKKEKPLTKSDKKIDYETENKTRQKWGFYFEDIVNLFIKENKSSKIISYPEELRFLQQFDVQRYYDAIKPVEHVKIDSEMKKEIELLETKDTSMFYSKYPPDGFDFYFDLLKGLHFMNYTFNHQSIDGGFAFAIFENQIEDQKSVYNRVLKIITYDVTIGDKAGKMNIQKIGEITSGLKKIYENINNIKGPFYFTKENFVKHYFIILENANVCLPTDKLDLSKLTKAKKLNNKLNKLMKKDRDLFGIIVARFVKIKDGENEIQTLQLFPFPPVMDEHDKNNELL